MRVDLTYTIRNAKSKPTPPVISADDVMNTLSASHELGSTEILVSENSGVFMSYTGTIDVDNVDRPYGYWRFKIRGTEERYESDIAYSPAFTELDPLDFNLPTEVTTYATRGYLFSTGSSTEPVSYTSSDETKAKVYLKDGRWVVDYLGEGTISITATKGIETNTKTVNIVNETPAGRIVNVGTGTGSLTIDGVDLSLQSGDVVVIKEGTYSSLTISDIIISDGQPKVYVICDGLVEVTSGMTYSRLRNVIIDASTVEGIKHGIVFRDNSNGVYSTQLNKTEFRNIRLRNIDAWRAWDLKVLDINGQHLYYDGTESTVYRDCTWVNLSMEYSGKFEASEGGVTTEWEDPIRGLCYNFKFIGCESHEILDTFISVNCGFDILFKECYISNTNLRQFNHVGVFIVRGHADVVNCISNGWYGNIIRLWACNLDDGTAFGNPDRKAIFCGNIGFSEQAYGWTEVQPQERFIVAGRTGILDVDVFNNTIGDINMATPIFWGGVVIDNYGMPLGYKLRLFNNLVFNTKKRGETYDDFFQWDYVPEGTTTGMLQRYNNKYYDTMATAQVEPGQFTMKDGHEGFDYAIYDPVMDKYPNDVYGNPWAGHIGAVQVPEYPLPETLPAPEAPVNDLNIIGKSGETYPQGQVAVIARAPHSAVGIKNYDYEADGVIFTTDGSWCSAGKQSVMYPSKPLPLGDISIRFRARDFRNQLSGWSEPQTLTVVAE